MKFTEYISRVNPGENVLIEQTSLSDYPLLSYLIGETYGWKRIILVDIIDSSLPLLRWMHLSNIHIPEDITRFKVGGISDWGNVVLEVNPHNDPGIFLSRFSRALRENYLESYSRGVEAITVVMNPERLIPIHNNRPSFIMTLAALPTVFLGDIKRRAFYFVNIDMTHKRYRALLEEAFTRILKIHDDGRITVLKSPSLNEEGTELDPL